eukprot:5805395-Prymnesium_polylepis.1
MLGEGFTNGLRLNVRAQALLIVCLRLGRDSVVDTLLTCLVLRALWDLGLCTCMAILISLESGPTIRDMADENVAKAAVADSDTQETLHDFAQQVRLTLADIGLTHVALHVVKPQRRGYHRTESSETINADPPNGQPSNGDVRASDILFQLYQKAPPVGVTLVPLIPNTLREYALW